MAGLLASADRLLRGADADAPSSDARGKWLAAAGCIVAFGCFYGLLMGTYSGLAPGRGMQLVYSAVKVPFLLSATFLISLPSFCVLNTLLGLRADLGEAIQAVAESQAVLTVVLASLAPLTVLWYASSAHYDAAILVNGLMFGIAALGGQRRLRRAYSALIARDRRHAAMLRVWLATYAFVGIQMGWVLRPFIGAPQHPPSFFRQGAWDNAYEIVARMAWRVLTGSE